MARQLQRSVFPAQLGSAPAAPDAVRTGSVGHARARADAGAAPRRPNGTSPDRADPGPDGVPFAEAMDELLSVRTVDRVTRVRLDGVRSGPEGSGPGLARAMFRFVMPNLRHPEVLRADNHRTLLEALEAQLLRADRGDDLAQRGVRVIQQELWRLASLRIRRNGLIDS